MPVSETRTFSAFTSCRPRQLAALADQGCNGEGLCHEKCSRSVKRRELTSSSGAVAGDGCSMMPDIDAGSRGSEAHRLAPSFSVIPARHSMVGLIASCSSFHLWKSTGACCLSCLIGGRTWVVTLSTCGGSRRWSLSGHLPAESSASSPAPLPPVRDPAVFAADHLRAAA